MPIPDAIRYWPEELTELGRVEPTLKDPDGSVTVQPAVVERVGGKLPWDNNRQTTIRGETIVNQVGDMNLRVTLEGIIFKSQLKQLFRLRERASEVRIISETTDVANVETVAFDQLNYDRQADTATGTFTYKGETVEQPLFTFQLQSKENNDDVDVGFEEALTQ